MAADALRSNLEGLRLIDFGHIPILRQLRCLLETGTSIEKRLKKLIVHIHVTTPATILCLSDNEDSSPIPNLMVYESKSTRLTTFIPQNLSSLASMTPLICFHCIILLCCQGFRMSKSMLLSYGLALILFSYNFLQSRA
ncbi:hypothetical protein F8388_007360 [Cannabis sativa]|uniref:Uncharacterized protein n=1 Tax=Cannabis sativa TaxID=3483 RepID=A0A7J6FJZ6_CANSA|nr:hypothetical protein F8388_007360 [Cannabis sativa]